MTLSRPEARSTVASDSEGLRHLGVLSGELAQEGDVEDGPKPGVTEKESAELREARRRIRLLEQEAEVMRRAVAYLSRDVNPK